MRLMNLFILQRHIKRDVAIALGTQANGGVIVGPMVTNAMRIGRGKGDMQMLPMVRGDILDVVHHHFRIHHKVEGENAITT